MSMIIALGPLKLWSRSHAWPAIIIPSVVISKHVAYGPKCGKGHSDIMGWSIVRISWRYCRVSIHVYPCDFHCQYHELPNSMKSDTIVTGCSYLTTTWWFWTLIQTNSFSRSINRCHYAVKPLSGTTIMPVWSHSACDQNRLLRPPVHIPKMSRTEELPLLGCSPIPILLRLGHGPSTLTHHY